MVLALTLVREFRSHTTLIIILRSTKVKTVVFQRNPIFEALKAFLAYFPMWVWRPIWAWAFGINDGRLIVDALISADDISKVLESYLVDLSFDIIVSLFGIIFHRLTL